MYGNQRAKVVTIIGSGFSGALTAIRLLQFSTVPLDIRILERQEGHRYGGLAFGVSSTNWEHKLNLQAGRITLYRERAEDFMEWVNCEADRSSWPQPYKYHTFGISCAVPRRIYGQYLQERLRDEQRSAVPGVTVTELSGEAIDVVADHGRKTVKYVTMCDRGMVEHIESDYVVFATGHLKPTHKNFYDRIQNLDLFVADPYASTARQRFDAMDPDERVLVVGTALSGFDAVLSLLHAGHRGNVVLSSRAGNLHPNYPTDHHHDIWQVRRPPFLDADELTPESVILGVQEEFEHLRETLFPQISVTPEVFAERVIKAWEPYIPEVVARLSSSDVRTLLDRYKSLIVTKRIGTVPEIGDKIRNLMETFNGAPAMLEMNSGSITDMVPIENDTKVRVVFSDRPEIIVDRVVNCLGNETDYSRPTHPLWQGMVNDRGLVQPHAKTGRGLEVNEHGRVIDSLGRITEDVFCVGPMRQGDETARRGRLGSFVFSIGTIRNECFETAMELLRDVRQEDSVELLRIPDTVHYTLADGCRWVVDDLTTDRSTAESEKLSSLVISHVTSSTAPAFETALRANRPEPRRESWSILAAELAELREQVEKEFDLPATDVRRLLSGLAIVIERNAVHSICDLGKLATWRSAQYESIPRREAPVLT